MRRGDLQPINIIQRGTRHGAIVYYTSTSTKCMHTNSSLKHYSIVPIDYNYTVTVTAGLVGSLWPCNPLRSLRVSLRSSWCLLHPPCALQSFWCFPPAPLVSLSVSRPPRVSGALGVSWVLQQHRYSTVQHSVPAVIVIV